MTTYELAPEVEAVAKRVIEKHHPTLRAVRIEYVFREKAAKRHGRAVAGTAKKVTGVNALLATPGAKSSDDLAFFLVTIAQDIWISLDSRKREALVDHELTHCAVQVDDETGEAVLAMRGHDIEEFAVIVQRHGLWSDDLEFFVTSLPAEQLAFAGSNTDDLAVTISHVRPDGTTATVETSTGEIAAARDSLLHGGESPGQGTDDSF